MSNNIELLKMLKRHEGFRSKAYRDTEGYLTIGYGRNLDVNGISQHEAEIMLITDAEEAEQYAHSLMYWNYLNRPRKDVIVSMIFNLGRKGFMGFKKMNRALMLPDFNKAALEILDSKAAQQTGKRYQELAEIMATGEYVGKV